MGTANDQNEDQVRIFIIPHASSLIFYVTRIIGGQAMIFY